MLHEFVGAHREQLLSRCRAKAAVRSSPLPVPTTPDCGIPRFLDQLVEELQSPSASNAERDRCAAEHGRSLHQQGFTVSDVVRDYGDVCQSITDLAVETGAPISATDFRTLNRCLDDAIAFAVTEYTRAPAPAAVEVGSGADGDAHDDSERCGFLAHELRNLISTAWLAFEVIHTADVGVRGSTGGVLKRSLSGLRDAVDRSVAEVRRRHVVQNPVPVVVSELIDEVARAAALEAAGRGLGFVVRSDADGATVLADRQTLGAAIVNLLNNALKFTRPATTVRLSALIRGDRVLVEVADECGGLPEGNAQELFRPFEQRHSDRTGLGLGLAFSRWGVEINGGQILVANVAHRGCVFTIDLPLVSPPAATA
jgi:hypothetical protein